MLYQVKKFLFNRNLLRHCLRYVHNDQSNSKIMYPLQSRKLLRVAGPEAEEYLQGLITNDMRHFGDGAKSMYAMFLNNKGRVLYDSLIHKHGNEQSYLIECDGNIINLLHRHLKLFKLRRKIDITDASQDYKVWALIASETEVPDPASDSNISILKDPRLSDLGYRVLSLASLDKNKISNVIGSDVSIEDSEKGYRCLKYKLGVSEGAHDLPPGTTFPLEVNCDYLHGVSFHKGCYIGQEVTARVHHTGVVRKRIMPIKFHNNVKNLELDSLIKNLDKPKFSLGKLKGFEDNYGICLVRIKEAMEANELVIGEHHIELIKPTWWPIEAPKEKSPLNKLV